MRNRHCRWFTVTMLAAVVAGSAIVAPAAAAEPRELTTVPPTPKASGSEPTLSPSPPPTPAGDVHNEPNSTGQVLPLVGLVSGVAIIGGCLIVVVMMGRERRRRDLAELETGEGSDER
ncbi:hypothetical protein GCM10027071_20240 [Microbacterium marinum]